MGKVVQIQRKGRGNGFKAHTRTRKGAAKLRTLDFAEREGYVKYEDLEPMSEVAAVSGTAAGVLGVLGTLFGSCRANARCK